MVRVGCHAGSWIPRWFKVNPNPDPNRQTPGYTVQTPWAEQPRGPRTTRGHQKQWPRGAPPQPVSCCEGRATVSPDRSIRSRHAGSSRVSVLTQIMQGQGQGQSQGEAEGKGETTCKALLTCDTLSGSPPGTPLLSMVPLARKRASIRSLSVAACNV